MAKLRDKGTGRPVNEHERQIVKLLVDDLPDNYYVIPNSSLAQQGRSQVYEYDVIVVAPHAVYVVEAKAWNGEVRAISHTTWQLSSGREAPNPHRNNDQKSKVLVSLLERLDLSGLRTPWVQGCIVACDDTAFDVFEQDLSRSLRPSELCDYICDPTRVLAKYPPQKNTYLNHTKQIADYIEGKLEARENRTLQFGNYTVTKTVSQTDELNVYYARSSQFDNNVVYRVRAWDVSWFLNSQTERDKKVVLLKRSANALNTLADKPNILPLADFGETDGTFYEVVRWPERGTLATAITNGLLNQRSTQQKLELLLGIATGLQAAQAEDIFHRNLNPDVILLDRAFEPRICDFDLAYIANHDFTVYADKYEDYPNPYRPLELDSPIDNEVFDNTDLYSLGIIAFEILTGHLPQNENQGSKNNPVYAIPKVSERTQIPEVIRKDLDELIRSLCQKQHHERPDNPTVVVNKLTELIKRLHEPASPPVLQSPSAETATDQPANTVLNRADQHTIHARTHDGKKEFSYLCGKELGVGASAVVYLATKISEAASNDQEQNSEQVAIKVARSSKGIRLLEKEALILDRVLQNHRNRAPQDEPLRVVRSFTSGTTYYCRHTRDQLIELEYLPGETLESWLAENWWKRESVTPIEAVRTMLPFARDLALALKQLQLSSGDRIIHRDLKPANIMVTPDGLRLFDFNIARVEDRHNPMTKYIGTPTYKAPEENPDHRADFFCLGIITWEILHQEKFKRKEHLPSSVISPDHYQIPWPSRFFSSLTNTTATSLKELMVGLLVDPDRRISDPNRVLEILDKLEVSLSAPEVFSPEESLLEESLANERSQAPVTDDILQKYDLVQLVMELRPSGLASVVADSAELNGIQRLIRERTRVETQLETFLSERAHAALAQKPGAPRLLMLSGNAGDGKSYLIDRLLRHELADVDNLAERVQCIADATHATEPTADQHKSLQDFFAQIIDPTSALKTDLFIIAMNTGMVIRFFEEADRRHQQEGAPDFSLLYREIKNQLGLKRREPDEPTPGFPIDVINLDLRSLLYTSNEDEPVFFEQMLDRLDINDPTSLLAHKSRDCEKCPARTLCPVRYNLLAIQQPTVRRALLGFLQRAELDPSVHLSPRNLWGFLYRMLTGGQERYKNIPPGGTPCDMIRRKVDKQDNAWLLSGQFTQLLFSQGPVDEVWSALEKLDPAYTVVPLLDRLYTRLTINKNLDASQKFIAELGGENGVLCGLELTKLTGKLGEKFETSERHNAALRRHVFFSTLHFEAWSGDNTATQFPQLLEAYATYSHNPRQLTFEQGKLLEKLGELIEQAIVKSYGYTFGDRTLLRVSQPNTRTQSRLFIEAHNLTKNHFHAPKIIQADVHAENSQKNPAILETLAYKPRQIILNINGFRLMIDVNLYAFLQQVSQGQQPSTIDLSKFQALRFAGERLGNQLATAKSRPDEMFILDGDTQNLHLLKKGAFGGASIEQISHQSGGAR